VLLETIGDKILRAYFVAFSIHFPLLGVYFFISKGKKTNLPPDGMAFANYPPGII
jgi:hypothetical protein